MKTPLKLQEKMGNAWVLKNPLNSAFPDGVLLALYAARRTSQLLRHVLNEKQRAARAVTRRTEATVRVCAGAVWGGASSRLYVAPQPARQHPHRMQPSHSVSHPVAAMGAGGDHAHGGALTDGELRSQRTRCDTAHEGSGRRR
jgi:hypothetical protein